MLDELFEEVGCEYFSDMTFADAPVKEEIARIIEARYPSEAVSLQEWNDALDYLTGSAPEATSQAARDKLLRLLQNST